MAHGLAKVNEVHGPARSRSEQTELFPAVPPRLVRLDSAPVLFSALTQADYEPAGFLAHLPHMERKE
ncbi:MAG: hypothetical protein ABTD50_24220 [Polyangiaceae bacterium]|jgi:hypothetical protein